MVSTSLIATWPPEIAFFVSLLYHLGELMRGMATTLCARANFGISCLLLTTVVAPTLIKKSIKTIE